MTQAMSVVAGQYPKLKQRTRNKEQGTRNKEQGIFEYAFSTLGNALQ